MDVSVMGDRDAPGGRRVRTKAVTKAGSSGGQGMEVCKEARWGWCEDGGGRNGENPCRCSMARACVAIEGYLL